jgi:RimJ/RimL family protein N-acetyltransferase
MGDAAVAVAATWLVGHGRSVGDGCRSRGDALLQQRPRTDTETFRAELTRNVSSDAGPGLGYFSIFALAEPSRFLGYVSLHHLPDRPEIQLGYRLVRAAWGRGFAWEASRAVLEYGFGTLGLGEIVAVVHPENFASQAVMGRLGFTPDGRRLAYGRELLLFRLPASAHVDANPTRDARRIS